MYELQKFVMKNEYIESVKSQNLWYKFLVERRFEAVKEKYLFGQYYP